MLEKEKTSCCLMEINREKVKQVNTQMWQMGDSTHWKTQLAFRQTEPQSNTVVQAWSRAQGRAAGVLSSPHQWRPSGWTGFDMMMSGNPGTFNLAHLSHAGDVNLSCEWAELWLTGSDEKQIPAVLFWVEYLFEIVSLSFLIFTREWTETRV